MRKFLLGGVVGLAAGLALGAFLTPMPAGDVVPTKPVRLEPGTAARPPEPSGADHRTPHSPAPTPPAPSHSQPGPLKDVATEKLLAELEAAARTGGPAPNRGRRLQLVAGALHGRQAKVPAALMTLLLDHDDPFFRSTGAYLLRLAKDPAWGRLPALAADCDAGVRYCAIFTAGQQARRHPEALLALEAGLSDPEPRVRRMAFQKAAPLARDHPSVRPALVEALRDPDGRIRRCAESCAQHLGVAGARHALDALANGRYRDVFVRAVVKGGLVAEALKLDLTPRALTELACVLRELVEEGQLYLAHLELPWPRLLSAALRHDDDTGIYSVYTLAIHQGQWDFVAGHARDGTLTTKQRRRAVIMLLEAESVRDRGLDVAAELILDAKTPQALRLELADALGDSDLPDRARSILRRVAETDPDPDVREKAQKKLR